jgi:C1A family cysteine protease
VALEAEAKPLFLKFEAEFKKVYGSDTERTYRFGVFIENLAVAKKLTAEHNGNAEFGVTKFMDLTKDEFKRYLGFKPTLRPTLATVEAANTSAITPCPATNCNWEDYGAVTPVKDQGQCGSCWAFSATEATETAWHFSKNKLPILAPQQIVDCDTHDAGCNGGDTPTAYAYLVSAGGQEDESDYPYTARDGTCKFDAAKIDAAYVKSSTGYKWGITPCNTVATHACDNQDEKGLVTVVQTLGPQSICVDAEPWQTYRSGIFNSTTCKHGYYELDHCVHLTGYGVEGAQQYWLVKNSWGTSWGEAGYIRLAYGNNECGVADEVTYAVTA